MNHSQSHSDVKAESANTKPYLTELDHLHLIRVSGEDAAGFLQGQFSNDLTSLQERKVQRTAYCNPKGRILALINIMRNQGGFWMAVPTSISAGLISRLRMFVMRAKVTFEIDDRNSLIGLIGPIEMIGNNINSELNKSTYAFNDLLNRFWIIGNIEMVDRLKESAVFEITNSDKWRQLDIQSGIPQIYSDTVEAFIPQMINMDLIDGISFKKGCYPGQEIVARLKYLGKLKQRMIAAKVRSRQSVIPGTEIFSIDKPNQKPGIVVDAIHVGDDEWAISAMVPATMVDQGDLHLLSPDGEILQRLPLPYSLLD